MCLYNNVNDTSSIAEEAIEVYKVVERVDEIFRSPFQSMHYKIGATYPSNLTRDTYELNHDLDDSAKPLLKYATMIDGVNTLGTVEQGLHTFASLEDAQAYVAVDHRKDYHVILRCVIPAGSEYYKGAWFYQNHMFGRGYMVDGYVSSALTVIEEVK